MSRLEQMRERFLRKVHHEQWFHHHQHQTLLMMTKSTMNLSISSGEIIGQQNRTRLQPTLSVPVTAHRHLNYHHPQRNFRSPVATISRHRSLNNVSILPEQPPPPPLPPPPVSGWRNQPNFSHHQKIERRRRSSPPLTFGSRSSSSQSFNNNNSNNNSNVNSHQNSLKRNYSYSNHQQQPQKQAAGSLASSSSNWSRTTTTSTRTNSTNNNSNANQCKHCQRKFSAKDRLARHEEICARVAQKHRPVFQSSKQRGLLPQRSQQSDGNDSAAATGSRQNSNIDSNNVAAPDVVPVVMEPEWKQNRQRFLEKIKADRRMKQPRKNRISAVDDENFEIQFQISASSNSSQLISCTRCDRKFGPEVIQRHETFCNGSSS